MAGRGPAPKADGRRARRNAPPTPLTTLDFEPAAQPPLPEGFPWPERTLDWWRAWGEAPQAALFSETDWQFLFDTALLHATAWASAEGAVKGGGRIDTSQHAELRIRVAKFGATVEDRARLRIVFADADEKDARRPSAPPPSTRDRRGTLHALPDPAPVASGE